VNMIGFTGRVVHTVAAAAGTTRRAKTRSTVHL